MIAIQCTQKILKEVGQEFQGAIIPTVPLGCWHANLLILDRRKCVLFTNDKTRYSFLVPGLKKPDFKMLDEIFRQGLFRNLIRDGFSQEAIEKVLDEIREVVFTRTSSRSVLGTMNDMANIIKWTVLDEGGMLNVDVVEMNSKLNRMPLGPLDYKFAIDQVREALA
ncbi:hypothetical protein A7E75_13745 [Syntrophotalea acetylenica]|uniref:DUF6933 domain-containing protein n=2 Tax=Syntrophotalea acetylenica TaxID=29542 RepID=A0A1L3GKC1_SYNAC|nr:hypothetical protein A7E75_13745 [Syntrophotalea acetylenica]